MNRHCYRVIFNKTLARLVVVSEKTHSHSKTNSQGGSQNNVVLTDSQQNLLKNGYYGKLKLTFALILLSLGIINICHASPNTTATTVVADSSANKHLQPMIMPTASGMVSVNIQTPNDKGLSNNHYSQFDVGSQGVILNNNRKAVATQLAGFVDANPFMARGEASTILNQVNSNKASMLNGFVEVAGQKADVIIANPNGLQINGAGFINAANVHLVSGVAQVYDGKPSTYHVGTGAIVASGKLNAGHTDYTALIAKSMQLNDEIYAGKQLDVITGENLINIQDGKLNQLSATSKQASSSQTNQTANNTAQGVALDISALGGMYAGSIRLIGTNQGLGVNNAGIILSTGNDGASPLSLDIKGNLINTGTIAGKDKLQINTSTLENLGTISSESGNIALTTNHLNNSGTIFSNQVNQITASHHINNQGDIYGGAFDIATNSLNNAGKLIQTGKGQLAIKSDTLTNTNQAVIGQSLYHKTTVDMADPPSTAQASGGVINAKANHTNSSSNTSGAQPSTPIAAPVANGSITTQTLTNQDKNALIAAAGGIDVAADTSINQNQSSIDVQSLSTKTLSNTNSKLAVNNINWHLTHFDNTQGTLTSKQDIMIATQNSIINQQGILAGNGKLELSTEGDVDNHQGVIQSAQGDAIILAQNIQNSQGSITASDTLSIMATDTLNNTQGNISAQGDATLTIGTTLNNTDGSIQSAKALTANTQNLSNSGQLYAAKTTLAVSKHLVNNKTGVIASAGDVDIFSDTISNTGSVIAGMKADGALLATPANLTIHATKELSSSGVHVATNHLQLGGNVLTLTDSQSQAKNITLDSKSTTSTQHAKVAATDVLNMVTPDLLNNTQGMLSASNINIHTEKLNNHQGSMNQSSQDDFSLTLKNGLDNRQGSITTNAQNFNIHTSTLNNHQGHIKHTGAILGMIAADVNNTQGSIVSTGDHTLNVKNVINNHQGIIQANTLTTTAKQLDNSDGKLLTSHHQSLTLTNDINNHQGLIQAGDFTITAKQLNNHQGILLATDDKNQNRINLTGELNNTNTVQKAATIAAAGNLLMTASKLQNTGNISSQTLGIQADKIHHAGNITSQTNVVIKGVLGIENTQTSSVFAGGDVILSSQSGIAHHGQLTAVNHLSVDAAQLDLSGSTNQAANISYASKADIAHQHATSSATNGIVINNTNGIFSNQQGNITAKTVNLDSKALQNGGSIYAKELTVHQIDDYTHAKQDKLIADNLNFNTQGSFTNQGELSANQALSLNAKSITNDKDATINAANLTHLDSQSYLNNQGLINGNATYIKAKNAINNQAGGRIYGTHLAIAADTLNNTPAKIHDTDATNTAPVIAARQRLDIGVNYLNNHPNPDRHAQFNQDFLGQALITSLGSLHIGGGLNDNYHAIGKAQKIVNRGATTQSGGQMLIDTKVLKNENAHFEKVAQVIDRQDRQIFYRNRENPSRVYGSHEAFLGPTSKKGAPTGALYIKDAHGNHHRVGEEIDEITVDLVVYKDHTRWSDPARMVAGQDLITYGNQLINDKSQMNAGAGFAMTGDKVVQTPDGGLIGQTIKTAENGNFVSRTVVSSGGGRRHKRIDIGSGPYTQTFAPLETYELPILNATITTTPSKPTINQVALADSDIDAALEALKSNQSALSTDAQKQLSALLATKALGQTVDKALLAALINKLPQKIGGKTPTVVHATPDGLTIPNSALYTINASHPNLPIIQTDPAFTNHKNWLSSEYMLTKLDVDANHIEKRLGDGYYEQKQLQDQYQLLTGRHLLSDYQSQEQAFKTLMDQGITFAKQYQLSLGVALSAKQMANLTTDMVWLVKQPITYTKKDKEGNLITHTQEALVPKLYLRPANTATARLQPDGRYSSIGAKNINMHLTGNLDNGGNITATDALSIQANNATNKGNINAKFVAIDVNQDLINQHRIHADHAAALTAGHDIINQSQTSHQSQKLGQSSSGSTHIRQLAQISVGDGAKATDKDGKTPTTLSIKAGNYVIYTGANSQNQGGNTLISANKGIRLDAIKESSTINAIADNNNYFKHSQSKDIGSVVGGQGDVVLVTTGQDAAITGKAVNISSQASKVRMSATGDIRFEEGRQTNQLQIVTQFTDKGLISKKTTNHQHHADEDKALTNTIQAEQITLTAGKNLQLTASNIASDTHIHLKAKGDVVLDAAINSQDSQTHTHTKKSGMFASSATAVTLGKQTTKTDDNHQKTTHTGNQLAALGGNVIIEAGDQYKQIASDIYAADNTKTINNPDAGNVLIKAQEAHITSATNTNTNHNAFYQKTSGITASVSSSMVDNTKSIDGLIDATQESQSTRLKAMGVLAAAAKTKNLLDQIKQGSLGSIRAQATLGTSTNKNQSTSSHQSNQASTINTDGNLIFDIQGKGTDSDLVITGSHINVGNNLYQKVAGDVIYQASSEHSNTSSSHDSKSAGVGVYASANLSQTNTQGSAGFTAHANLGKGSSTETATTHTNTTVQVAGATHNDIKGNFTLDGANLTTKHLTGAVDGDLIVKSRQDTYQYDSKQQNIGGSADIDFSGKLQNANINLANSS